MSESFAKANVTQAKVTRAGFVAIVGRPNAGKSTLLNGLLGSELSIVSSKAQTTRDRVLGILTDIDHEPNTQMVLVDTPGIHQAAPESINAYMVDQVRVALEDVVCVWYLIDPWSKLSVETVAIDLLIQSLKKRKSKLTATPVQIYLILNKVDQLFSASSQEKAKGFLAEMRSAFLSQAAAASFDLEKQLTTFTISALAKTHTDELLKATRELLPESPFYYPDHEQLSDRHMRFFVAEKIREQCFKQLGDELPYSCGVEIDSFKEGAKLHRVEATIFVERDSQKPMIIGKGGLKIKSIGQEARIEIEKMMGQKLYLGLRVKVLKNWTQDQNLMKRFGYQT